MQLQHKLLAMLSPDLQLAMFWQSVGGRLTTVFGVWQPL
jgi:hypothetical protein